MSWRWTRAAPGTLHRLDEFADSAGVHRRIRDVRHRAELICLMMTESPWGVLQLAARHFIPDCEASPAETLDINVMGTQNVVDACAARLPERLLFASTADVYAPSATPHQEDDRVGPRGVYGWSKLLGERLLCDQAPSADTNVMTRNS